MIDRATFTLLLAICAGCNAQTQRLPGPIWARQDPLPPGSLERYPPGPEEVVVLRHADPVQLRLAGTASSFPMPFYDKQARVTAGSWVFCESGGRAEILWPDNASAVLYGNCTAVLGSPSRGEVILYLREVERASIVLSPGQRVELLGGALLLSDTGPFFIERSKREILSVHNRSKGTGQIAFRDAVFDLDPGQVIDIPLLEAGGSPFASDPSFQTFDSAGLPVMVRGGIEVLPDPTGSGLRLRATGEHELRARGVRMQLAPGEEVLLTGLGSQQRSTPPPSPPDEGDPNE